MRRGYRYMDSSVYAQEPRGAQWKSRASKLSALLVPGELSPQRDGWGRGKWRKEETEGGKEEGGEKEEAGELANFPPPTFLFSMGFPDGSDGKESACNAEDPGSVPGSGISPGEWQSAPVFLPGKFHGQRSFVGYSP